MTNENHSDDQGVNVTIHGTDYLLHVHSDVEFIQRVAKFVDQRMSEIDRETPADSVSDLAVMTALDIASDLFLIRRDQEGNADELHNVEQERSRLADELLYIEQERSRLADELLYVEQERSRLADELHNIELERSRLDDEITKADRITRNISNFIQQLIARESSQTDT